MARVGTLTRHAMPVALRPAQLTALALYQGSEPVQDPNGA